MAVLHPMAIDVKPMEEYRLLVTFDNLERRLFDVAPYSSALLTDMPRSCAIACCFPG